MKNTNNSKSTAVKPTTYNSEDNQTQQQNTYVINHLKFIRKIKKKY